MQTIRGCKEVFKADGLNLVAFWKSPYSVRVFNGTLKIAHYSKGKPVGKSQRYTLEQLYTLSDRDPNRRQTLSA